ncbi:MAG: transketolase family protein [Actinobacteria bacterium]|nr:transketolase family protein [Actinomycetota bacterium]MCL5772322.1 transketolase family protein [Actinomycetota bacterium]
MDYISGRESYGRVLVEIGENEKIVVLDADVSKATKTSYFAKKYPERFFNVGIAEQNLLGVAAGLAVDGKIPVASTFAVFATCKALDQIRNVICKSNLNVKIVATHAGLTVGEDGASHQSVEDISIMRSIPNIVVIIPADGNEAANAIKQAVLNYVGPVYIRLSRFESPILTKEDDEFTIGKAKVIGRGSDLTIVSTGILLANAIKARDCLKQEGVSAALVNLPTIKPIDRDILLGYAKKTKAIITVEENTKIGGLYSAVSEVLSESFPVPIMSISINDKFGMSGSVEDLSKYYSLTEKDIVSKSLELIKLKERIYS